MTPTEFYQLLGSATGTAQVEQAVEQFESESGGQVGWVPVGGRENNRGVIELSANPGRSLVERITNAVDAVLELEFERHNGSPDCRSPKEAASAWLNVPQGGLSELTAEARRALAQRATVRLTPGEDRAHRIVEIRDSGIGLTPDEMPRTILSLNESNKIQKYYLAGTYGQGGSSTFVVSKYTLIASRGKDSRTVGFTIVKFLDLPPETYKTGHYVYLVVRGRVPEAELSQSDFPRGTQVKHFGYDLTDYPSPLGPNSVYGLLNEILFDPIMPIWLDNPVNNQRRVIKGARNALNGAIDEGDDQRRGPTLSHNMRMFYVRLGEFGRLGVEYWVLESATVANKRPSAAFVNPSKPILLTVNGQNHAELSSYLIRKEAALPYLASRLICHLQCDNLTPASKRALFVSSREEARRGAVYSLLEQELVRILRSDDVLLRLNEEARRVGLEVRDEDAMRHMRSEVARLLRLQGENVVESTGAELSTVGTGRERPTHPRTSHPQPQPIELHEPPTFIRIVHDDGPVSFHPEQRKYIRIETDAESRYHNPDNPRESRINLISTHGGITLHGSTPLQGGRMRAIFECAPTAQVGSSGSIRVELSRTGLPVLSDECQIEIVPPPPVREDRRQIALPEFEVRPVEGPEDQQWLSLGWPEDASAIASETVPEDGKLVVYYSRAFPAFRNQFDAFEARDPVLAVSFAKRYEIWLAVHALLIHRDQQSTSSQIVQRAEEETESIRERQERCRAATMAAFFARNEVQSPEILQAQQEP